MNLNALDGLRGGILQHVRDVPLDVWFQAGLVTNSILFCSLLTIKDRCKKVRFQQTENRGLRQLLWTVSWDLRA